MKEGWSTGKAWGRSKLTDSAAAYKIALMENMRSSECNRTTVLLHPDILAM
jgi:hypothetical protein